MQIRADIINRINVNQIRKILKEHKSPIGMKKSEMLNNLKSAAEKNLYGFSPEIFDQFVANEVSHGRNRSLFISAISLSDKNKMSQLEYVKNRLREHNLSTSNFNNIKSIQRPDEFTLVYLNIKADENSINQLDMAYAKKYTFQAKDLEGQIKTHNDTDHIWISFLLSENKLIIKLWEKNNTAFGTNYHRTRLLYGEIIQLLRNLFNIGLSVGRDYKEMLFDLFKDLTDACAAPYRDRVSQLSEQINAFSDVCINNLSLYNDHVDIPSRLKGLLERALIQSDFTNYQSFAEGKKGIVGRIAFSDATGAYVNARASASEGRIEMADIYFDTKDTIEQLKGFDKLWITWFFIPGKDKKYIEIPTRIEVYKGFYVIHFLHKYTTKEIVDYVLSCINQYE